jgi:hypothetical protein
MALGPVLLSIIICLWGISAQAQGRGILFGTAQSGLGTRIDQEEECISIKDCPFLLESLEQGGFNAIREFDMCGFDEDQNPLYKCPIPEEKPNNDEDEPICKGLPCLPVTMCPPLGDLLNRRKFSELRKHQDCGFLNNLPKYCCNIQPKEPKKVLSSTVPPFVISVSPRIRIDEGDLIERTTTTTEAGTTTLSQRQSYSDYLESYCGIATVQFIFNGEVTTPHEYPWAAALVYETANRDSQMILCGGAIVSETVIVTAAHCMASFRGHSLTKVRIGHANTSSPWVVDMEVESFVTYPGFGKNLTLFNDLALIKLVKPIEFDVGARPVCLPKPDMIDEELVNGMIKVAGWGANENSSHSELLLQLDVNYVKPEVCEAEFQAHVPAFMLLDTQMCAKGRLGSDSCRGDSGGPLMLLDEFTGHIRIVGVTSFGTSNCDSSVPGVYTRLTKYLDWITDFMYENRPV